MNCQTFKSNIRKEKLKQRLSLSKQEVELKSKEICFQAFTNFFLLKKEIGLYFPFKNEVNPLFLMGYGINRTSFPAVSKDKITFKRWEANNPLQTASLGIKEPMETAEEIMPEILIVPLLAFDSMKYRIGYGGGYYDKFLSDFKGISIGFAYDFQMIAKVPIEAHDLKLDYIITETKIYE